MFNTVCCPFCKGKGYFDFLLFTKNCPVCRGYGKLLKLRCPVCGKEFYIPGKSLREYKGSLVCSTDCKQQAQNKVRLVLFLA